MNKQELESKILDVMFTTKPCPDGAKGLACPRCMAHEIATAIASPQQ